MPKLLQQHITRKMFLWSERYNLIQQRLRRTLQQFIVTQQKKYIIEVVIDHKSYAVQECDATKAKLKNKSWKQKK